jgi:hypothetical protein
MTKSLHDDDLVTIGEAERELELKIGHLRQIDKRTREGAVTGMPRPVITGRSARLWSMRELAEWWKHRVDGRTLRHTL